MDIEQLKELMRLLEDSSLAELEIEDDSHRIRLSKATPGAVSAVAAPAAIPVPAHDAPAPAAAPAPPEEDEYAHTIDAPMVGTFYTAPAPGEPPFVLPGNRVDADSTVGIIEAMKIMNEVTAAGPCVIERVLVENGEAVEFGQPLFAIRPAE